MTATLPMRPASRRVDLSMRQWREQVVSFGRHRGWLTHFSEANVVMATGFPTVTLVRTLPDDDRRIVFALLVPSSGKLTSLQAEWLHGLNEAAAVMANVEVHAWKPSDWPLVRRTLI